MHMAYVLVLALAALAPFEKDGRWGYRDDDGRIAIPPRYQIAREFSSTGIAAVVDEKGWAYIDKSGRIIVRPLVADNGPDYFHEGLARFRRDGKVGFFDEQGRVVIQPGYTFAMPFSDGRAAVCDGCAEVEEGEHRAMRGGKWGFIDRSGRLAIPLEFTEAGDFENGRARVRASGKWHYIGKDGKVVPQATPR